MSCLCKSSSFSKCFKQHLYKYEGYLRSKFHFNRTLLTGVIAANLSKKSSCFFRVKSRISNTQKLKLGTQKVQMDGLIKGYMTPGGNLNPFWPQKMFFCLISQEFCDFSGTCDLRYLIFLRMQFFQNFDVQQYFWFSGSKLGQNGPKL